MTSERPHPTHSSPKPEDPPRLKRVEQDTLMATKRWAPDGFQNVDFSGLDFTVTGAWKLLVSTNLRGANLTGARLDWTFFSNAIISHADMPHIRIKNERIDLLKNEFVLPAQQPWATGVSHIADTGSCGNCESRNRCVLGVATPEEEFATDRHAHDVNREQRIPHRYHRRGILITHGNEALGYVKLLVEKSFLAARTVRDSKGNVVFWKGMIYALDPVLLEWMRDWSAPYKKDPPRAWFRVDIAEIVKAFGTAKFGSNNLRFTDDPAMYAHLDELCERVRSGAEPYMDVTEHPPRSVAVKRALRRIFGSHKRIKPVSE